MYRFTYIRKITALMLLVAFIAPFGFTALPKTAFAQNTGGSTADSGGNSNSDPLNAFGGAGTQVGAGLLGCAASGIGIGAGVGAAAAAAALTVPTIDVPNLTVNTTGITKECVLDGLAVVVREVLISSMTQSIVNWINNGFEGEPAFISDLQGFMLDVADQVVGQYIQGSQLAFLCSPFKINIRIALALDYYARKGVAACTLTGAIQNVKDSLSNFSNQQSWNSWFELSINPNNNPLGAFLTAQNSMREAVASAQSNQQSILNWGNGFRSQEVCDKSGTADPNNSVVISGGIGNTRINCRITTPGTVINNQLNDRLGTGGRQLELADEINEIIGALLGQLTKQVLGGSSSGLRGLSSSSYNRPSYVDQLVAQSDAIAQSSFGSYAVTTVDNGISIEQQYISQKKVSLERLNTSETLLKSLGSCWAGKLGGSFNPPLTATEQGAASAAVSSASSTIAASITPLQTLIANEIQQAEDTISKLLVIKTHLNGVASRTDVERIIAEELDPLVRAGAVRNQQDFIIAQQQKEDISNITTSMDQSTNTKLQACSAFPDRSNTQNNI